MVDTAQQIQAKLAELNELLGDVTPYKLALVEPKDVKPAPKNARFMQEATMRALVSNVAQDGNLSSLPFCWQDKDGQFWCMSGHHRIEGAEKAGVEYILVLYTDAKLSKSERVAIQLSHNSLVGEDDPTVLRELYVEIKDLDLRVYSGLDDATLEIKAEELPNLFGTSAMRLQPVTFLLFDYEVEAIEAALKRIGKRKLDHKFAADIAAWTPFYDRLLTFAELRGIVNVSTALLVLLSIADKKIAEELARMDVDEEDSVNGGGVGKTAE